MYSSEMIFIKCVCMLFMHSVLKFHTKFITMRIIFYILGFAQIWILLKPNYNEAAEIKFTNLICESYNKSWVVFEECRLRAVSRNITIFNVQKRYLHPANDILLQFQFFKKANGYKPFLYKGTIDTCRFFKKAYNPIGILLFNVFKKYTNINHTCPYVGTLFIKGLNLRVDSIPVTPPTGDYLLTVDVSLHKKLQYAVKIYVAFVENLI